MTMRLYADRKGLAAERFSVRLCHRKVHAHDCADCETKEGNIGEITSDITIEGDIPEAARTRLMEIADKCPVHETLTHEIKIRSRLIVLRVPIACPLGPAIHFDGKAARKIVPPCPRIP